MVSRMKLGLALVASLSLAVGCVAGSGPVTGDGGTPNDDGLSLGTDAGGGQAADGGAVKSDGGASPDATTTGDPVPLKPHYDITIDGKKAPLTQLFLDGATDNTKTATTHHVSIQGLFNENIVPGSRAAGYEASMWLELTSVLPKGTATCDKVDLTIYYSIPGGPVSARPVNPGGSCTVTITEPATGLWTAGTVTGIATWTDGTHPLPFTLSWAEPTVE